MNVADEAKAAAEAEYPAEDLVLIRNGAGEPMAAIVAGAQVMSRVPFAHGYQRGHAARVEEVREILALLDTLNESGRMWHDDYSEMHDMVSRLLP